MKLSCCWLSCLLFLLAPSAGWAEPLPDRAMTIRVMVLNFDPVLVAEGVRRLHAVCGWNDPPKLAEGYASDVREVVRRNMKVGVECYTQETFVLAWRPGSP